MTKPSARNPRHRPQGRVILDTSAVVEMTRREELHDRLNAADSLAIGEPTLHRELLERLSH